VGCYIRTNYLKNKKLLSKHLMRDTKKFVFELILMVGFLFFLGTQFSSEIVGAVVVVVFLFLFSLGIFIVLKWFFKDNS